MKEEKIFFSTLDTWNGYHSIPLAESARNYFGYLTEWDIYRYKVAPQGFIGSGDHYVSQYNSIMHQLRIQEQENPNSVFKCFTDTKDKWKNALWHRCINDMLMWASSMKQAFLQCAKYMTFCGLKGIIFNPKKLEVAKSEVNIFGFRMTQGGILPSLNQIETMMNYPSPKNLRDMRGFLGLVNQATFCLSQKTRQTMELLKDRMKSSIPWDWTSENQKNFDSLKKLLSEDSEKGVYRLTSCRKVL